MIKKKVTLIFVAAVVLLAGGCGYAISQTITTPLSKNESDAISCNSVAMKAGYTVTGSGNASQYVVTCTSVTRPTTTTTRPTTTTTTHPTTTTTHPTTTTQPTTTTTLTTTSTTTSSTTTTTIPTTTTSVPAPTEPVSPTPASYFTSSLFNQTASNWPIDPNSSAIVANLAASVVNSGYNNVTFNSYYPVIYVNANTPLVPVTVNSGCNDFTGDQTTPNGSGATGTQIPFIGADAYLIPTTSDHPLVIFEPSTGREWELWIAAYSNNSLSACWGGEMSVSSSTGFFPAYYGLAATGASYLADMITEQDVASGSINHAMALQLFGEDCTGWVYPAPRGDCGSNGVNQPAEGDYFIWPSTVNCAAYDATPLENMICQAGKTKGFIAVDQAGNVQVMGESSSDGQAQGQSSWTPPQWVNNGQGQCCVQTDGTDPISLAEDSTPGNPASQEQEYNVINNLPWSSLEVVDPPAGY